MRVKILVLMLISLIRMAIGVSPNLIHAGGSNTTFLPLLMRSSPPLSDYRALTSAFINGQTDLYTIRPDGSDIRALTNNAFPETNISLSPDNQWVLFTQNVGTLQNPHEQVRAVRSDGTEERLLADMVGSPAPYWSPDGNHVAILSYSESNTKTVYLSALDMVTPTLLLTSQEMVDLTWSPDGKYLAYRERIASTLHTISIPEGTVRQVANDIDTSYSWSPDSTYLAFRTQRTAQWEVALVHPDGEGFRYLTDTPEDESVVGWVNQGQQLLTVRNIEDTEQLLLLSLEGGSETEFTEPLYGLVVRGVSPDGSKVLWRDSTGIWLQSITSTTAELIERQPTEPIYGNGDVTWSDDFAYAAWTETYLIGRSTDSAVVLADFTVHPPVITTGGASYEGSGSIHWFPRRHTVSWVHALGDIATTMVWDIETDMQTPIPTDDPYLPFNIFGWWIDPSL